MSALSIHPMSYMYTNLPLFFACEIGRPGETDTERVGELGGVRTDVYTDTDAPESITALP